MNRDKYFLSKGAHRTATDGRCAMEWVSYLAGEPHSDQPVCVSPVLKRFCISFNDGLDDSRRQRLRPYLARTIGTAGDGRDGERAWLATDWLVRIYAPTWLSLAGLEEAAGRLRMLSPVLAAENPDRAMVDLRSARREAFAARATARARCQGRGRCRGAAAWDAARAGAAAWAASGAASGAAAWDAARAASGAAAWDAAGAGAGAALQPTVELLQDSAFGLLDRMLPTEIVQIPVAVDAEEVCALS